MYKQFFNDLNLHIYEPVVVTVKNNDENYSAWNEFPIQYLFSVNQKFI
jgi:hypothetical protein